MLLIDETEVVCRIQEIKRRKLRHTVNLLLKYQYLFFLSRIYPYALIHSLAIVYETDFCKLIVMYEGVCLFVLSCWSFS
ncbi:transmembrane protein, putative (macronuclear) [Tetrahymena thermophila SB210]|uniref:Transmembrane protein, putative n=1 Tax=Tetrahymena thermophila (strain SB210) TaxID=312017 RepID=W7XH60_TETTS|nr:transmembrane protein, putative [Tetrahymena thermophila SB210]EWS73666.1 transmembrane protein, putative [Tetrahymena thermophila SB210]|eukprot:XP_012653796.1 transmembrane protein, putative [Tetrahymena thermophila SB210]